MKRLENFGLAIVGLFVLAVMLVVGMPIAILTDVRGAVRFCIKMGEEFVGLIADRRTKP